MLATVVRERTGATHLDKNVPVAVVVERIRVGDLELANVASTVAALPHELLVGVLALRVLVQEPGTQSVSGEASTSKTRTSCTSA